MSKKCEWKDDEKRNELYYMPCGTEMVTILKDRALNLSITEYILKTGWKFCPFCGADIKKPEPEVIIKESGGTWVYKAGGIDYFVDRPQEAKSEHCLSGLIRNCGPQNVPCAKPISEITITDEIAKLRPIVIHIENKIKAKLYGVEYTDHYSAITDDDPVDGKIEYIRLATVSDLP